MSMYAKLFSRITESSLMEEPINVRYTFVMLLAVADPEGYAIGTDVALCRRFNMPLNEFKQCIEILMRPDPDSNSKEEEGRRVIISDIERGYKVVNYKTYREIKDQKERREYMREYMRSYRGKSTKVNGRKQRKLELAGLTQGEEEVNGEVEEEAKPKALTPFDEFWKAYPRKMGKGSAEKAWKTHKCDSLLPRILVTLRTLKTSNDWTKDGGKWIPFPATWLNRKGWMDEAIPEVSKEPGTFALKNQPPVFRFSDHDRANTAS